MYNNDTCKWQRQYRNLFLIKKNHDITRLILGNGHFWYLACSVLWCCSTAASPGKGVAAGEPTRQAGLPTHDLRAKSIIHCFSHPSFLICSVGIYPSLSLLIFSSLISCQSLLPPQGLTCCNGGCIPVMSGIPWTSGHLKNEEEYLRQVNNSFVESKCYNGKQEVLQEQTFILTCSSTRANIYPNT